MPTESRSGHDRPADPTRRRFFALGAGVTATSAAALTISRIESPEEQVELRYSRTPHVERYYALNRL